jgi:hypothetical protein
MKIDNFSDSLLQVEPQDYSTAVTLAAQAALESMASYEEYEQELVLPTQEYQEMVKSDSSKTLVKSKSSSIHDEDEFQSKDGDDENEEDFVVTTYKGRFQCPRPNCSKVLFNLYSYIKIGMV